jgi:ATP-dependent Lhr-like helicase
MRFLFAWQHVGPSSRLTDVDGLRAIVRQLDGVELPARAWERHVLPSRLERYDSAMLDMLCLTGEIGWARLSTGPTEVVGATPIALFLREHTNAWVSFRALDSDVSSVVLDRLRSHGASFGHELAAACQLSADDCRSAIGKLVAAGLVTSDGFAGLRALVSDVSDNSPRSRRHDSAGRWSMLSADSTVARHDAVDLLARTLLQRYGIVFRRLLAREAAGVPWRELARVYRILEARGEIRGGRFVSGMSGEQFALPDAVDRLRELRRAGHDDRLITISAADPLNLTGVVTAGDRIRAAGGNRLVYRNGVPLAAMEGDMLRMLTDVDPSIAADVAAAAAGRRVPVLSGFVGRLA